MSNDWIIVNSVNRTGYERKLSLFSSSGRTEEHHERSVSIVIPRTESTVHHATAVFDFNPSALQNMKFSCLRNRNYSGILQRDNPLHESHFTRTNDVSKFEISREIRSY